MKTERNTYEFKNLFSFLDEIVSSLKKNGGQIHFTSFANLGD